MKGTYITNQAKCVNVLEFDAVNKMAYTDFGEGDIHWAGEPEYKDWVAPTSIPDIPAQIEETVIEEKAPILEINNSDENVEVIEEKIKKPKIKKDK